MNNAEAFASLLSQSIDFAVAGDNVLVSGTAKQRIFVYRLVLVVGNVTNLMFKNGTLLHLTGTIPMVPSGSITLDLSNVPWFQTTEGNDFILSSSGSVQVGGVLYYQKN